MADGYEQDDMDMIYGERMEAASLSVEEIYSKLGCDALES